MSLTETLTDALENFLDDRWFPHKAGDCAAVVYRHAPDFDNPLACEATIAGAYHQVVVGVQQLIELARGPAGDDGRSGAARTASTPRWSGTTTRPFWTPRPKRKTDD